jgi:hypothetical protein
MRLRDNAVLPSPLCASLRQWDELCTIVDVSLKQSLRLTDWLWRERFTIGTLLLRKAVECVTARVGVRMNEEKFNSLCWNILCIFDDQQRSQAVSAD